MFMVITAAAIQMQDGFEPAMHALLTCAPWADLCHEDKRLRLCHEDSHQAFQDTRGLLEDRMEPLEAGQLCVQDLRGGGWSWQMHMDFPMGATAESLSWR